MAFHSVGVEHSGQVVFCSSLCSFRAKCQVAQVFVRLLEQMWLGRSSSCAPVEARSLLCSILPQFNNHSQQDAQELLLLLFNALHDDLKKVLWRIVLVSTSFAQVHREI